jgi:hypothetical protein
LGHNQPSIGFGFRMMERYGGLPQGTTSNWVTKESALEGDCANRFKLLKLPSGKSFRVIVIVGEDNNEYSVIEVNEKGFRWVCGSQVSKYFPSSKEALIDFLRVAAPKF